MRSPKAETPDFATATPHWRLDSVELSERPVTARCRDLRAYDTGLVLRLEVSAADKVALHLLTTEGVLGRPLRPDELELLPSLSFDWSGAPTVRVHGWPYSEPAYERGSKSRPIALTLDGDVSTAHWRQRVWLEPLPSAALTIRLDWPEAGITGAAATISLPRP